jgi:hypothetical protein
MEQVAADVRRRKAGIGRGSEDRRPRTEDGRQKSEVRGQKTEDRGRRMGMEQGQGRQLEARSSKLGAGSWRVGSQGPGRRFRVSHRRFACSAFSAVRMAKGNRRLREGRE